MALPALPQPDVLITGAGVIGLSLALELHSRGAQVVVLERDRAFSHASSAAAGMLADLDPHNPSALSGLAGLSISLYPAFLRRIEALSGIPVPFQTDTTIQHLSSGKTMRLVEHSLDPRQLGLALCAAIRSTNIDLREHASWTPERDLAAKRIVHATGAWPQRDAAIFPRKGQMLRVRIPAGTDLGEVHRREDVYIVPRTQGVQAGTALIGATVEDAGYDTHTHAHDLAHLRSLAAELVPALGSETASPQLEAWAGLRPATADSLPLLGACETKPRLGADEFVATGHFRNGILLAPATAMVMADLLEGRQTSVDLTPFSPTRFNS
ncbi:MAG TPA: FAD-dependent oxidoreductase [Acidobacteriaceae bacterium]|jgi:glycine oxidase